MSNKLDFIYSKMDSSTKFTSTKRMINKSVIPPRTPIEHSKFLATQLSKLERELKEDAVNKVSTASHSLIAIQFAEGSTPSVEQLESSKEGIKVLYEIPETNTVIIDSPNTELLRLRKKINEYGEKTYVHPRSVDKTPKPVNNAIIAPMENIQKVLFTLVLGKNLEKLYSEIVPTEKMWFEFSCRGGLNNASEILNSRNQIIEAVSLLQIELSQEFVASEKVLFFIQCSLEEASQLFDFTDCIFEVEAASSETYNWLLSGKTGVDSSTGASFEISTNPESAVITLLDSGINSSHPLLQSSIVLETSVHPEDTSPVDIIGHGTEMAGLAIFGEDISRIIEEGGNYLTNQLESVRVFTNRYSETASFKGRGFWPRMIEDAVTHVEVNGVNTTARVFNLAITATNTFPGSATSWSLSLDQLSYNEGKGRLFCVSIGNADIFTKTVLKNYPIENHLYKLEDPSQAFNVLTVGGFTSKNLVPNNKDYKNLVPIAPEGGISPHTRSGNVLDWKGPIKPEIVFEAGNIAMDSTDYSDHTVPTLTSFTTGHDLNNQYVPTFATSMATSLASKFAADLWNINKSLKAETIRGLMVHSASWTPKMIELLQSKDDLMALCGYGVPSFKFASECAIDKAIVIVEDELSNVEDLGQNKLERPMKFFTLPLPSKALEDAHNSTVELRVTLSYFAEPNSIKGVASHGMDLVWDIQGPLEDKETFKKRINKAMRSEDEKGPKSKSFAWDVGIQKRSRGTVQSDRWSGPAVDLSGDKLIAVYPKYGWWDQRKELRNKKMKFSLIITVVTPDVDVYNFIKQRLSIKSSIPNIIENKIR